MNQKISILSCILLFLAGCEENYSPKPMAYYRIDFPEKEYLHYADECPFQFDYSKQSILDTRPKNCWLNIHYPQYGSTIHLSYIRLDTSNLNKHIEDSRNLAMKHLVKANDISERQFKNEEAKVYGLIYDFEGNTASNYQFFLTDSSTHFFRGAMYFNMPPNADSLEPVIDFIKGDLQRLIESFRWAEASRN